MLGVSLRKKKVMCQLKTTGEIWKLDRIETINSNPKDLKVYVFEMFFVKASEA
jgi:hypothetical protein